MREGNESVRTHAYLYPRIADSAIDLSHDALEDVGVANGVPRFTYLPLLQEKHR